MTPRRDYMRAYMRRKREEWRRLGVCHRCGCERDTPLVACSVCQYKRVVNMLAAEPRQPHTSQ